MDDDILTIVIAGRVDAGDDEELLIGVEGVKDVLQLGAQRASEGEISRADSREGQSQICSKKKFNSWQTGRRILRVAYPRSVSCCSRHLQPRRRRDARHVDPAYRVSGRA